MSKNIIEFVKRVTAHFLCGFLCAFTALWVCLFMFGFDPPAIIMNFVLVLSVCSVAIANFLFKRYSDLYKYVLGFLLVCFIIIRYVMGVDDVGLWFGMSFVSVLFGVSATLLFNIVRGLYLFGIQKMSLK